MKLLRRRQKPELDDQLAIEIERTGIDVQLRYSEWLLEWFAEFSGSGFEYSHRSRESLLRYVVALLKEAPDREDRGDGSD